jgi:hypothetical protein
MAMELAGELREDRVTRVGGVDELVRDVASRTAARSP